MSVNIHVETASGCVAGNSARNPAASSAATSETAEDLRGARCPTRQMLRKMAGSSVSGPFKCE